MNAKGSAQSKQVRVAAGEVSLEGDLVMPAVAPSATLRGLVVFAHGSGSSRLSPRNRLVADVLNRAGLATLLFDLLTREEDERDATDAGAVSTRALRFDIELLARRLVGAVDWVSRRPELRGLPLGLFGASTGAAAALIAAAARPARVVAVVSRGGRPDLAAAVLPRVRAPTLLIVGGHDTPVLQLNRQAAARLRAEHRLDVISGASHLFEEPGKLEQAAGLARDWFLQWLGTGPAVGPKAGGTSGAANRSW